MPSSLSSPQKPSRLADLLAFLARLSFAATIVLIPFRWRTVLLARPNPPVYGDYTDFLLFAADIAMLATLLFWGASLLAAPRKIKFGPAHIWIPLLGLTLAGWLSLTDSWDAPLTVYHALRFSFLFLYFLFIVNEISTPVWVVTPVAVQLLIQSIVAIGQSVLQHDLGLQSIGEYELDPLWRGVSVLESGGTRFLRAYGLSDHPNILGGCLAFGLIILLAAFIYGKKWNWLFALVFIPASVALLLTFSRSAWVAFAAGSVLIVGVEVARRNVSALKRVGVLMVLCLLAAAPFVYRDRDSFATRFGLNGSYQDTDSNELGALIERAYLFDAANKIFVDHALTGVGLGVSPVAMKYTFPESPIYYQPPHFTLLVAAEETGIFGASFYFALLMIPILIFFGRRMTLIQNLFAIASFAILLAIAVIGLFDYYPWLLAPGQYSHWLGFGLWAVALEDFHHAVD